MMTIGRAAMRRRRTMAAPRVPLARATADASRAPISAGNATLPVAEKTGRITLRPYSVVHSLIFDSQTRRASGVKVIDGQTHKALEFQGRIVFLCASALESTRILLNSATPEFSTGLANSSGELGKNLMDHIMGSGADGIIPVFWIAFKPGGAEQYLRARFRNVSSRTKFPPGVRL
jgi:choline dehydrogenase-like flavoprotein